MKHSSHRGVTRGVPWRLLEKTRYHVVIDSCSVLVSCGWSWGVNTDGVGAQGGTQLREGRGKPQSKARYWKKDFWGLLKELNYEKCK